MDGAPSTPAEPPPSRAKQKRRPHRSGARGSEHRSGSRSGEHGAHRSPHHHVRLQRKVSFDPIAARQRPVSALSRHASFDPRLGARSHGNARERASGASADQAAWAKLVARAQNLEEALASERASKRLLAARAATEKAELQAKISHLEEKREGFEHLWRDGQLVLQRHTSEWEVERTALYQEIAKLRRALSNAGLPPVPPSMPPSNLAVALRDDDVSEAGADEIAPTGGATPAPDTSPGASSSDLDATHELDSAGASVGKAGESRRASRSVSGAGKAGDGESRRASRSASSSIKHTTIGAKATADTGVHGSPHSASRAASSGSKDARLEKLSRQASNLDGELSSSQLAAQVANLAMR